MAGLYVELKRRPCYVGEKRAFFNCWSQESQIVEPSICLGGHGGGIVAGVLGIVEYEDGSVAKVYPEKIKFADVDGDENKYFDYIKTKHLGKFIKKTDETETIKKYEQNEHRLLQVSGYDVEKLIELFAAGYTLQPPNKEFTTFDF